MPASALDRNGLVALWQQVRDDLRRRIDAGEFSGAFPGEKVLAVEYGVSRQTMRQALRPLREAGVVSASRGRTPRVRTDVIEQPIGALYSLFTSVETAGMEQRSQVLALDERADAEAAGRLGLPADAPLIHLERLRLAGAEPLALDRVWLPAAVAAPLLEVDFTRTALYTVMAERCGDQPRTGHEIIHAVSLSPELARLLHARSGEAAFHIERVGRSGERVLEWRTTIVRGDRFRVTSSFSPSDGFHWAFDAHPETTTPSEGAHA